MQTKDASAPVHDSSGAFVVKGAECKNLLVMETVPASADAHMRNLAFLLMAGCISSAAMVLAC